MALKKVAIAVFAALMAGSALAQGNVPVVLTATGTISRDIHLNTALYMAEPGGNAAATFTLPDASGSGDSYQFHVGVVNTSNYLIKVADAGDTMDGSVLSLQDAADTVVGWETAATSDTITLNGTTTGGVAIGDYIILLDCADEQWCVRGVTTSSGTEATPFSATVS